MTTLTGTQGNRKTHRMRLHGRDLTVTEISLLGAGVVRTNLYERLVLVPEKVPNFFRNLEINWN